MRPRSYRYPCRGDGCVRAAAGSFLWVQAPCRRHTIASSVRHPQRGPPQRWGPVGLCKHCARWLAGCAGVRRARPRARWPACIGSLTATTGMRGGCFGRHTCPGVPCTVVRPEQKPYPVCLPFLGGTLPLCVRAAVHCFFGLLCLWRSLHQAPASWVYAGGALQATLQSRAALYVGLRERNACSVTLHLASGTQRVCARSRFEQECQVVLMLQ